MVTALEAVFWVSTVVVLYAYVGYPLLLAVMATLRPAPPVVTSHSMPTVTLIIVAHDEERHIRGKISDCLAQDYAAGRIDVLVVSDGSSDGTDEVVAAHAGRGVRLLRLDGPLGKPTALNHAVTRAAGEIVVLCDARQRLAADAIRNLTGPFADPTVGAVSGELHISGADAPSSVGQGVGAYWRFEKWIRRLEARLDSCVGATGALYAVRRNAYRPIHPDTILDDVAVPMGVVSAGYRVVFEGRARAYDTAAESAAKEYRRKVRTLAGNYQLVALNPWLLDPRRNRLVWQFVSHKLLRLAVPWAALIALAASLARVVVGGSPLFDALLALEIALLGAAAAGWSLERAGGRAGVLSMAYALAVLNLAAATALFVFLRGGLKPNWRQAPPAP